MANGIFTIILCLTVFVFTGQALAQGGTWETKANMPTARPAEATGVIDGKLYAPGLDVLASVLDVYDQATDTWSRGTASPTPRAANAAAVIGGKLYVVGGCPNSDCSWPTNMLEVYDPNTDTWTTLTPMPLLRGGIAAAAIDGKLYVVGGFVRWYDPVNQLDVYNPNTNTWTTLADMPTAREYPAAVAIDGKLYALGGFIRSAPGLPAGDSTGKLELYDPNTNTWTTLTDMPTDRVAHAVGVINGRLYAVGGSSTTLGFVDTLEEYNPNSDTWVTLTPMPTARSALGAGVIDSKLYAAGGISPAHVATLEVFTPCQFELIGDLNGNCRVDLFDFAMMAENWLIDCGLMPGDPACVPK